MYAMLMNRFDPDFNLLHRFLEILCLLVLIGMVTDLFAAETPPAYDTQRLVEEARQFLNQEAAGLGEVHVQVTPPQQSAEIPKCDQIEAFLPPGARAQGKTTVGVRCSSPRRWTVFMQAQVQIMAPYLVAAHPLNAGQTLAPSDLILKLTDMSEVPAGIVNAPEALYGNTLTSNIPAGSPIRRQQIKVPLVIQSGQAVHLKVSGQGFQITGDGIAMSNASEGQPVQVRTPRGSLVSGIARTGGNVELRL